MFESDFDVLVLFPKLKEDKSRDDLVLNRREFVFLTCAAAHLLREENKEIKRMSAAIEKEANSRKRKQDAADKKEKAEKKRKSKALLISTAAEKKNCDVVCNAYLLNDYFLTKFNLQDIFMLKMSKSIIFGMLFGIV